MHSNRPFRSRREFLRAVSLSALTLPHMLHAAAAIRARPAAPGAGSAGARRAEPSAAPSSQGVSVRAFGARGDGRTLDTKSVNRAILHVAQRGGGWVSFPAGIYACHSIRLQSGVSLYLGPGATLLAADAPASGAPGEGYDPAETQGPWGAYEDYGHNHWHNSLIYGEGVHDIGIFGPGLIWGRGLSDGDEAKGSLPASTQPGAGNKAIALKNCRNVTLRDFSVRQGGWFSVLATGVDNLGIDNLLIDTNRDGIDLDCCRNVRVSRCTVNSPNDDGICPKSSYALGYARATEDVTISDCFVTGGYEIGSVLDGTWKPLPPEQAALGTGRIKCGTESNGGFRNIAIANCVFDRCRGIALESVDGAVLEDIAISGITLRQVTNCPIFLRLGRRMRAPPGAAVGALRRVSISGVVSHGASRLPSIIAGIDGHPIEDVKIFEAIFHQAGGGDGELAKRRPPEADADYPEPVMFGDLPATGLFIRHARNLDIGHVDIATERPDARPAIWMSDVAGADFFRMKFPAGTAYALERVTGFRSSGCPGVADVQLEEVATTNL